VTVNGVEILIRACNGLRMFFTLVLVVVPRWRFTFRCGRMCGYCCGDESVSAIICNVVRLMPTVWGMETSRGRGKRFMISGMGDAGVAFVMLYVDVWALKWAMVPVGPFTLARD